MQKQFVLKGLTSGQQYYYQAVQTYQGGNDLQGPVSGEQRGAVQTLYTGGLANGPYVGDLQAPPLPIASYKGYSARIPKIYVDSFTRSGNTGHIQLTVTYDIYDPNDAMVAEYDDVFTGNLRLDGLKLNYRGNLHSSLGATGSAAISVGNSFYPNPYADFKLTYYPRQLVNLPEVPDSVLIQYSFTGSLDLAAP